MKKFVLLVLFLAIMIPLAWILFTQYEGSAPEVDVSLPSLYLKKSYEMSLNISDKGTGFRKITVSLIQQGNERLLFEKKYQPSFFISLFSDQKVNADSFVIPVESRKYGMNDGEALLQIMVSDYSWRGWNKGNIFYEEKKVVIDTKPPQIKVLTKQHNIQRGGAGLVIYRLFEEKIKSGVMVKDNFFPGHSGMFADKNIYAAFFALNYNQGPGTQIFVTARDLAGNEKKMGFHHYIRDKNFKTDTLNISKKFLKFKMPDFDLGDKEENFLALKNPLLGKFLYINGELREKNVKTVLGIAQDTIPRLLWEGKFTRLSGSARRAGWADHRIYKHKGKEIDKAVHLGIDLASTANASVKAANSGRVIMAGFEGIFGNVIIIDHGFGLASLYSHFNEINVRKGDEVSKGDIIGKTGLTGLAAGDHLHFSMIVHNTFVNPVEWWDKAWIKNNITSKIESVELMVK